LQDEVTLVTDRLRLTLGSKFEHNDYTGFEIQPSVRLAWTPDTRQTVWGAISRAVRSPSRIDREFYAPAAPPYLLAGGTNFLSEDLLAYELGYRVQPIERLSLSVATYYNDYDHIRSLRPGSPFVIANDLKGESYGVELAGTLQITDWWRVRAGYNYLHKRLVVKPGGADLNNGSGEGNDPEHQFSFRSSMDLPGDLQLDAGLRFVDSLPSPSVPSYFGLDVRLQWKPAKDWELAVVGQNLVDRRHPEFGAPATREEIERSVYGRVTWSF
jgi:iron complex outermembrane receptor protein